MSHRCLCALATCLRPSALAALLFAFSAVSWAQFTYAPLNVPGAVTTVARGINNNGEIVGYYMTAACPNFDLYNSHITSCTTRGFKFVNNTYVKLMVPNSVSTTITGVNDLGDLVGYYKTSDGTFHGFIWYHTNVVKTLDVAPNSPAFPMAINKSGTVVGQAGNDGFVWANGKFNIMDPTSSQTLAPCCWSVNAITNNGIIAGQLFQADRLQAWLKEGADEDFYIDTPPGATGADTFGTGVNSATDVVGYGFRGWFAKHIELNEGTNDTEVTPGFITVAFPGASQTIPYGLNDSRGIVGGYTDSTGTHGFLAKPNF